MEIILSLIIIAALASLAFFQEKRLKRYRSAFAEMRAETDAAKARLEDRFYLEAIFSNMEEEVMLINRYLEITDVNPVVLKASGLSKEEIVGRHCYEIIHNRADPCQPPHGPCPLEEVFRTGKGQKVTHRHTGKLGEELVVEMNVTPIKDEKENVIQVIEVSRNITERERLKKQIIRTEKLNLIENFIGDVYHDIIDPLNILSSNLQIMRLKWGLEKDKAERVEELLEQTEKINRKVNNLQGFIKRSSLAETVIDINILLRKVIELVEQEIRLDSIDLHEKFAEISLRVSGKSGELSQVFLNLITVARESMHRKEREEGFAAEGSMQRKILGVTTFMSDDGRNVEVEIQDNGLEIPESLILRLGDPLHIAEKELSGLFLRLSTCYRIVEEHMGEFEIVSGGAVGTRYLIRLPALRNTNGEKE